MTKILYLQIFLCTALYGYLLLRTYSPSIVFHKSDIVRRATEKDSTLDKSISKRDAKKIVFKDIGKTDTMILVDEIMTDLKDVVKFSPIALALFMRSTSLYISYGLPLFGYFVLTKTLKNVVKKKRPDGINLKSFPSGHSASAFLPATFLWIKFGPMIGIPLSILATAIAISRVYCGRHTLIDITAGSLCGILSGLLALI